MKNKIMLHTIISSLICLLTMLIFLIFYTKLPNMIPVHWDTHGNVNNSISKQFVVFGFPFAYVLLNIIAAVGFIVKKEKNLIKLYIIPVIAIIMTIVVLVMGLK